MLLNAEDTKKQVLGITAYNGGIRVRQEDVLAYLRGYGIEIEVYDKMYVDESGVTQYFIPKTSYLANQQEYTLVTMFSVEHQKREVEVSQTETFLSLKQVLLFILMLQSTRSIHTALCQ